VRVKFWVTVVYVEPTYAQSVGRAAVPYRWTFELQADDGDRAVEAAIRRFREVAQTSGVGWVREIVSWDVIAAPPRGEGSGR
jgi:hypothetical protein